MTAIALASAKGAPGVTTSALLLAAVWPGPACLVEADPRGGDLRYWQTDQQGRPLRPETGVVSLLSERRTHAPTTRANHGEVTAAGVLAHTQRLAGGLPVLVGVSTPRQHQALASSWTGLREELNAMASRSSAVAAADIDGSGSETASAVELQGDGVRPVEALQDLDGRVDGASDTAVDAAVDALVDVGGLTGDRATFELLQDVAMVLLVCHPTVSSVAHTRDALASLRAAAHEGGYRVGVVVIGSPAEAGAVRDVLTDTANEDGRAYRAAGGGGLFVGQLAADQVAARGLAGTWTRRLDRSPLVASGRRLARDLHAQLNEPHAIRSAPAESTGRLGQSR